MDRQTVLALAPLLLLCLALVGWSLLDIARHPRTRHLPRWAWALLAVTSVPVGAVAYLTLGRDPAGRS